jgi:phosphatidylglycerophosphatase A
MTTDLLNRILKVAIVKSEKSDVKVEHSKLDYVALSIATFGVGYIPIVPATWGSLVGIGIYLIAGNLNDSFGFWVETSHFSVTFLAASRSSIVIFSILSLFLIGIWASNRVCKLTGKKDPRIVVIDEVVGQLIVFMFVPAKLGWISILFAFLAFRFFDIFKLYPANRLEEIPGGLGVMADDVMAGFYAAAFMSVFYLLFPITY